MTSASASMDDRGELQLSGGEKIGEASKSCDAPDLAPSMHDKDVYGLYQGMDAPSLVDVSASDLSEKEKGKQMTTEDDFPEGGRGWLVVLGTALLVAATAGLVVSWGVFQSQYQVSPLPNINPSTLAWIGSVQYALIFLPGLVSGRLFDLGYFHSIMIPSSCVMVVATLLVGECREYWQFMLVQGIVTGLASAFIFGGAVPVVGHWFKRRLATAYGAAAMGTSYGGTVFPIMIRKLIPLVGLPWTSRILALVLFVHLSIGNLLVRRRLPPKNVSGGLFNLRAFESPAYSLYVAASTVGYLGMYTCLTYIDVSGVEVGLSRDFSFYLVSFVNAASGVARLSTGLLSDRFGSMNILIPSTCLAAVFTFAWPYCTTKASLILIALLYGASSGAFIGLLAAPVARLGGTDDIGRRTGMMFTVQSLGAVVGPPISGAIYARTGGFRQVGVYAGVMILISAALIFASRWKALGGLRGKF